MNTYDELGLSYIVESDSFKSIKKKFQINEQTLIWIIIITYFVIYVLSD